nr:phage DNA packaging protein C [Burkholderia mallei]
MSRRPTVLSRSVKDWLRYASHLVHGSSSLVDILTARG